MKEIMAEEIQEAFEEEDYSGAATYNIDEINFIDTVNQSTLTHQQPSQMKMSMLIILSPKKRRCF